MNNIFDVAVIGAGSIGSSMAYYNAKNGASVALIDSGDIAAGTSSRCDGNILVSDKMPGFDAQFTKMSQDMFDGLAKELDYPIEWTRKGSLILIESEAEMEAAKKFCAEMVESGMPMRILNQKEVHEDEPLLADDIIGGIETACDGSLNPMAMCYAFALRAEKLGAKLMLHNPVTSVERQGGCYRIHTKNGEVIAKNIVNCGGVWSPVIGKMVGLDIPVQARQGQILVAEQTFQVARRKVYEFGYLMAKFQGGDYKRPVPENIERNGVAFVFEPTHANNFLIGSSRRFVGEDVTCEIDVMQAIAQRAIRFFPVIADIKVIRAYAGVRPYTPDHMPIISDTPLPGFYIATGHEGDGIGLAPITAKCISNIIAGERPPMDISHVSYSRFLAQ
jgi:sarcosine oxidase subunit beta